MDFERECFYFNVSPMKKILALLVAAVMCFSMGAVAFADAADELISDSFMLMQVCGQVILQMRRSVIAPRVILIPLVVGV